MKGKELDIYGNNYFGLIEFEVSLNSISALLVEMIVKRQRAQIRR